jgi:malate synthase
VSAMATTVEISGPTPPEGDRILTPEALAFVADLERRLGPRRLELLERRRKRDDEIAAGAAYGFLPETEEVRRGDWKVAPTPPDLERRHVEITGPVERKMMINAFNSGADVFMADFEDSLSPTWDNVVKGQANLIEAIRRTLTFRSPEGKDYALNAKIATLLVRPRGWHLVEKHATLDGKPVSASLFDFGLFVFHNARALVERGSGPYFYLPKMESHLEARLWNDAFVAAQSALGLPRGTVRATVLIETLPAAFEMDEILYELRDHMSGLNAGRWDYLFSLIKKLRGKSGLEISDRAQLTMTVPFMRSYTELLVKTCHRRGAHAMGGMAAFIPSRRDPDVNRVALAKVKEDKDREAGDGFDGTWVAHPDLVPTATESFDKVLGERPNQLEKQRPDVATTAAQLVDVKVPGSTITKEGLRLNISVGIQYIESWLRGTGAAAINNLMEDVATAEISRSQVWQWVHQSSRLEEGPSVTADLVREMADAEMGKLKGGRFTDARKVFEEVALSKEFQPFLTLVALRYLE